MRPHRRRSRIPEVRFFLANENGNQFFGTIRERAGTRGKGGRRIARRERRARRGRRSSRERGRSHLRRGDADRRANRHANPRLQRNHLHLRSRGNGAAPRIADDGARQHQPLRHGVHHFRGRREKRFHRRFRRGSARSGARRRIGNFLARGSRRARAHVPARRARRRSARTSGTHRSDD